MRGLLISTGLAAALAASFGATTTSAHEAVSTPVAAPTRSSPLRPFTVDDLLNQERFGEVRVSPGGRWIVVSRQAPWSAASTYRLTYATPLLLNQLEIRAADSGQARHRLADPGHATGFIAGPFSPSGEQMVVYRLSENSWSLGVMTLATGDVRWLPITPEQARLGRTVAWRSESQLVVIARPRGSLPFAIGMMADTQARISALWEAQAGGRTPSAVYLPSGAARDSRAHPEPSHLMMIDLASGRQQILMTGELFDFALSPDGRRAAALLNDGDVQKSLDTVAHIGDSDRRRRLRIADLETGQNEEPLPDQDFASHLLAWSADSTRLLAFARHVGRETFADGSFWVIPPGRNPQKLELGTAKPWIAQGEGEMPIATGAWDDALPVVQVRTEAGARAWLRFDRHGRSQRSIPIEDPGERLLRAAGETWVSRSDGIWRFGSTAKAPEFAGVPWWDRQNGDGGDRPNWTPDAIDLGRSLLLRGGCLSAAASAAKRCVAPLAPGEALVSASEAGGFVVGRMRHETGAVELRLHKVDGVQSLGLVNEGLGQMAWGRVEAVAHPGPDGAPLKSWLLLPPNLAAGVRPPIAVIVYPGDDYDQAPSDLRPGSDRIYVNPHLLAAAGYAVLMPSLPLAGRPRDLSDLSGRLEAIVDAAAAQHGLDAGRVGIIGHSYGAYSAALVATQTDRFQAIVAWNGFMDLASSSSPPLEWRATAENGVPAARLGAWAESGQGGVDTSFPADPQAYIRRSPLYAANRIRTPILLIESDFDLARMGPMFGVLYRMNHEAALLSYYGEGHANFSPANVRDVHERIIGWLDGYVRGSTSTPIRPVQANLL